MNDGLFRLASVFAVIDADATDFQTAFDKSISKQQDAFWAWYIKQPYTPQRFLNWWVARRWIIPRDIRRS